MASRLAIWRDKIYEPEVQFDMLYLNSRELLQAWADHVLVELPLLWVVWGVLLLYIPGRSLLDSAPYFMPAKYCLTFNMSWCLCLYALSLMSCHWIACTWPCLMPTDSMPNIAHGCCLLPTWWHMQHVIYFVHTLAHTKEAKQQLRNT